MSTTKHSDGRGGNMENNDLHKLFVEGLRDMLWAEKELTKALPKMAKAAQSDELKEAFTSHLEETEQHVTKLEKVFESIGSTARAKKCPAIEGIVEEGEELIKEFKQTHACDAALIAAGQKAEHYEIASYGTLLCFARQMGHGEAENLLNSILEQEKAADTKLNEIATTSANEMAMQA